MKGETCVYGVMRRERGNEGSGGEERPEGE